MPLNDISSAPLQKKLSQTEFVARELREFLEQGVIPKAQTLKRTAEDGLRQCDLVRITDQTIRSTVEQLLTATTISQESIQKLQKYLDLIEADFENTFRRR
ncbi:hypothetical protein SH668x_001060 [Planctomicrobium sp. SH668]|uniref:hypothetical protein n=1 Tax=Planctomicrobium sp. SH668 TaxID=3448126 RepID=UPI003F5CA901